MIEPDLTVPLPERLSRVHFVGIGGSGMSGIARMYLSRGVGVSGSDRTANDNTALLEQEGADIRIGHDAENVGEVDAVVVTSALWPDNPELLEAKRREIPVLHRSQALAWLIGSERLVSVAGAHGKTTSTGMIVSALRSLGSDPSFVNGGVIAGLDVSSAPGEDPLFVVEADESDGSFLLYNTAVSLITNVEPDHLDHYGSVDRVVDAFVEFAERSSESVVISADDAGARTVRDRLRHPSIVTFGESETADVRVRDIDTRQGLSFTISFAGEDYPTALSVVGRHNAVNAGGAFAVLVGLGFAPDRVAGALGAYGGAKRRFELHGVRDGVSVYDDYAHHPTEVAAALDAARTVVGTGRIIAVHQPHLYSRTQLLAGDFAQTLEEHADHTIVLDVCGAREDPIPGVTGELVSERFSDSATVDYVPEWSAAAIRAASEAKEGDFIITLGCGDVYLLVPQILQALESESGRP